MTSWPWMKGVNVAVADPIDPVCPEDVRASVKELIAEHRDTINAVQTELATDPLYVAAKHDDLWILRFVLSHKKKVKAAVKAAKVTLAFRVQHGLDAADVRPHAPHKSTEPRVKEYWDVRCPGNTLIVTFPDKKRGGVCFIDLGGMVPGASHKLSFATWEYAFIYTSEWTFQWLDYITRTTGRLTRSVRIVELQKITMSTFNRRDLKCDGNIMDKMEDCYPQLLETIYACNAPSFIHVLWALARKIMPKRVVDKFDVVTPKKNKGEHDKLLKHISNEHLPTPFGGLNTVCPHEW